MKYFTLLILLLMFPATGIASLKVQKEDFVSHNKKRTYYLFVPENLKQSEPAPLIILLHGSGRDGLSLVDKWKELADKEGIILAGPNSADLSRWNTTEDGPSVIHDLVELLKSRYAVDPRRVYLFGHSGGAVYAILLSLMESQYFAATAIHAGALRDKEEFKLLNRSSRNIPLAIWVGTRDPFFSLSSVRATRDALVARGCPVEVTEMPGHDHWYYDLAPSINEAAWQFLKKYALPAEPRYEPYAEVDSSTDANKFIDELNKVLAEINALKTRVNALMVDVNARETALNAMDFAKDRSEINRIAQEEADLLKEGAAISRSIGDKASEFRAKSLEEKYRRYLDLVAQHNRKYALMLDVMREQAGILLGAESFEVINTKRADAQKRIDALRQEADDLYRQSEKSVH
jgi:poly(3-hydroxybutyrate) depolymerase